MSMGNDGTATRRILILGGTGEARALATLLVERGHTVTSSLAGRTRQPERPIGAVRIGGFGGVAGLAAYLDAYRIEVLIDATHPFAAQISANAAQAARAVGVTLIRIERPQWKRPEGAQWIEVDDMDAAAKVLPGGANVLLTIGRQELAPFMARADCRFVARMIEVPEGVPERWRVVAERGPFAPETERALMQAEAITHLVSKNAGGDQTAAKIEAAAQLGIPVVMVRRPLLPPALVAHSVADVVLMIDGVG